MSYHKKFHRKSTLLLSYSPWEPEEVDLFWLLRESRVRSSGETKALDGKNHDVFGFLGRSHTNAIILAGEMDRALVAPCATLKILILLQSTVPERICREWNTSPLTSVPYLELSSKRIVSKLESTNYGQDSATCKHLQTSLNCCSEIG